MHTYTHTHKSPPTHTYNPIPTPPHTLIRTCTNRSVERLIARQKRAISRPDLPRPKIWRPAVIPGEDDVSSDELSDIAEQEELLDDYT